MLKVNYGMTKWKNNKPIRLSKVSFRRNCSGLIKCTTILKFTKMKTKRKKSRKTLTRIKIMILKKRKNRKSRRITPKIFLLSFINSKFRSSPRLKQKRWKKISILKKKRNLKPFSKKRQNSYMSITILRVISITLPILCSLKCLKNLTSW